MINRVYRLVAPRQIEVEFEERNLDDEYVIIKPVKLSICAADQRYYMGKRERKIMQAKLPMALIHEAVGKVIYDPSGKFRKGEKVVMIPNTPVEENTTIGENYLPSSKFRSSGYDGFTQDYVFMKSDRIIRYENIDDDIASFIELISVAMHAIKRFEDKSIFEKSHIGVWGDGNLGFIISLILKHKYPNSKIIVFGKNNYKLNLFSFVDEKYLIDDIPSNIYINHAFEVVGGRGSSYAIEQIIELIRPEGCISLLGVSENSIEINTRKVLEKGITMIGSSRSSKNDFIESVKFLESNIECQNQLCKLISKKIDINSLEDLNKAFEDDIGNIFKTVLTWRM